MQYAVSAVTDGGESQSASTGIFPAGTPYTDFSESFADGENSTIIRTERLNYGTWAPTADNSEVTSQDGDGGFMAMTAYFGGYNGAFSTGKISLDGISAPALNFYSYTPDNLNADANPIEVFISADGDDPRHRTFAEDAFKYLDAMEKGAYDLIVLDPPAFAKRLKALQQGLRGYRKLNAKAFEKIRPGGVLFTFSCSQVVSREQFRLAVFSAAVQAGRRVRILHQLTQPADHPIDICHPEGDYLKGLVLYVE